MDAGHPDFLHQDEALTLLTLSLMQEAAVYKPSFKWKYVCSHPSAFWVSGFDHMCKKVSGMTRFQSSGRAGWKIPHHRLIKWGLSLILQWSYTSSSQP